MEFTRLCIILYYQQCIELAALVYAAALMQILCVHIDLTHPPISLEVRWRANWTLNITTTS